MSCIPRSQSKRGDDIESDFNKTFRPRLAWQKSPQKFSLQARKLLRSKLPREALNSVTKANVWQNFQISFCKMVKNKYCNKSTGKEALFEWSH